jgi:hypothetical protein
MSVEVVVSGTRLWVAGVEGRCCGRGWSTKCMGARSRGDGDALTAAFDQIDVHHEWSHGCRRPRRDVVRLPLDWSHGHRAREHSTLPVVCLNRQPRVLRGERKCLPKVVRPSAQQDGGWLGCPGQSLGLLQRLDRCSHGTSCRVAPRGWINVSANKRVGNAGQIVLVISALNTLSNNKHTHKKWTGAGQRFDEA